VIRNQRKDGVRTEHPCADIQQQGPRIWDSRSRVRERAALKLLSLLRGGPRVRILLPPAVSHVRTTGSGATVAIDPATGERTHGTVAAELCTICWCDDNAIP
jgi:hypothetical protein